MSHREGGFERQFILLPLWKIGGIQVQTLSSDNAKKFKSAWYLRLGYKSPSLQAHFELPRKIKNHCAEVLWHALRLILWQMQICTALFDAQPSRLQVDVLWSRVQEGTQKSLPRRLKKGSRSNGQIINNVGGTTRGVMYESACWWCNCVFADFIVALKTWKKRKGFLCASSFVWC